MTTPQMDVLYLASTGHVLAIFTRISEPAQIESDGSAFLGDGFHVRGFGESATVSQFNNQEFVIPVNQVGLLRTDLSPSQLIAPRQFEVTLPTPGSPPLQSLSGAPTLSYAPSAFTISSTPTQFIILVFGPTPMPTPGGPIQTLANQLNISGLVTGNHYFAIAFVPGQQIAINSFKA
jgi:hypothetical protein